VIAAGSGLQPEEVEELEARRFKMPVRGPSGRIYALHNFLFTWAIVADVHEGGYEDRWCYDEFAEAAGALEDWRVQGFAGEPEGWHRHPQSGRRRAEDGSVYLNP